MTPERIDALARESPVHRTEGDWLSVAGRLLHRVSDLCPGDVQLGPYWVNNTSDRGGSFTGRVRCFAPFPFVPSDYWEGCFCVTGDHTSSWSDLLIFPMRDRRVVRRGGVYWNLRLATAGWVSDGWLHPDGPGEWEWVTKADTCYAFPPNVCELVRQPSPDRPPVVAVYPLKWVESEYPSRDTAVVSLHDVRRNGESLGVEATSSLTDANRPSVTVGMRTRPRVLSGELSLGSLPVPDGWQPGEYLVRLRVRYRPAGGDGPASYVTTPIRFMIRG